MPEMPPPPPRRVDGPSAIDESIFDQETPVRQRAPAFDPGVADWTSGAQDIPDAGSFYPDVAEPSASPFASGPDQSAPTNPFLAAPAPVSSPRAVAAVASAPQSVREPRVIPPANGAPLVVRAGAAAPDIRDPHAEFRRGGWQRPLVLVLVAGAVILAMTLLPTEDKAAPSPVELSKAPPDAVIGRSLPPGRTTDEDVRAAEQRQMRGTANDDAQPTERPNDIPKEGEFANAFKAAAQ